MVMCHSYECSLTQFSKLLLAKAWTISVAQVVKVSKNAYDKEPIVS